VHAWLYISALSQTLWCDMRAQLFEQYLLSFDLLFELADLNAV
jgi:hypothetical protein